MSTALKRKSVLIIDDEVVLARLYAKLLRGEGLDARLAATPDEVLQILSEITPDLILLDCKMPLISGEELIELIKTAHPDVLKKSFIVGFSSFDPSMKVVETFKGKVHRLVRKPDDIDDFMKLIAELFTNRQEVLE